MTCAHDGTLRALKHDTYDHTVYGTCEACEMARAVVCRCGYEACCGFDLDEHVIAVVRAGASLGEHEAR